LIFRNSKFYLCIESSKFEKTMKNHNMEVQNTKIIKLIVDDQYKLLRHAVLLLSLLIIIFFSNWLSLYSGTYMYYRLFCVYSILVTMFYVNMNVLVPRFFFKGQYGFYLVLLFVLVLLGSVLMSILLKLYIDPNNMITNQHDYEHYKAPFEGLVILPPFILVTTMIKLFQRWIRDNESITELRNLTLTMELNELRNQINPHFLFNMLNGIKALVRTDQEKAATVIMQLSDFLRYQLYENNEEKTLLKSEMDFLSNFLELEKIRRDNLSIAIASNIKSAESNTVFLPPNLFTIFVENAVKHSVNISELESYIRITIEVKNAMLYFKCVNSKDPHYVPPSSDKKSGGLGLVNIKRRLELLYGADYILAIESTTTEYIVNLTIPL
jgi:sensor histidine kinase YesM